ncbi:MAG: methionyl-tRNA formyltransferase [Betaproteobacteria bacterium]|nr:MAG: methionyl-tRNA formyltransferase [Betaproteobacteria bacterium]
MRLVFAGTPEFAERALARLVAAGHDVALVLTQPDRPAGRGMRPLPSPVKRLASGYGIEVFQPTGLKAPEAIARVREVGADALVVAAYGLIVPAPLLELGRFGAINIHASLLPRWRGAAPIQRALLAGDARTGISIMQMDVGLDTGPVLAQRAISIDREDDAGTLHDKLADLGGAVIVEALAEVAAGRLHAKPQPEEGVRYAHKIDKAETRIEWSRPALELERAVRAFRPWPGAWTTLEGEPIKIWRAHVVEGVGPAGMVNVNGNRLLVGCGNGMLAIEELQRAGAKRLAVADFLRGRTLEPGARFT